MAAGSNPLICTECSVTSRVSSAVNWLGLAQYSTWLSDGSRVVHVISTSVPVLRSRLNFEIDGGVVSAGGAVVVGETVIVTGGAVMVVGGAVMVVGGAVMVVVTGGAVVVVGGAVVVVGGVVVVVGGVVVVVRGIFMKLAVTVLLAFMMTVVVAEVGLVTSPVQLMNCQPGAGVAFSSTSLFTA